MATTFWLIRHATYHAIGHTLGGRMEHSLTAGGRLEAQALAAVLQSRQIAAVVASPVRRAQETAAPIAAALARPVVTDHAFTEIDFSDWTGARFDSLDGSPAWQAWNVFRSTAAVPGGEAMLTVQARAITGLAQLAARFGPGEVVIVSHGDVIKAILAHFLGMPLDLLRRLTIDPASRSELLLHQTDAEVRALNVRLP